MINELFRASSFWQSHHTRFPEKKMKNSHILFSWIWGHCFSRKHIRWPRIHNWRIHHISSCPLNFCPCSLVLRCLSCICPSLPLVEVGGDLWSWSKLLLPSPSTQHPHIWLEMRTERRDGWGGSLFTPRKPPFSWEPLRKPPCSAQFWPSGAGLIAATCWGHFAAAQA